MEIILLVAFVAMVVLFAARAAQNQRAVVRVPARVNQSRARRRRSFVTVTGRGRIAACRAHFRPAGRPDG